MSSTPLSISGEQANGIRRELDRIASSPEFAKAGQLVRLLRYIVEEAIAGRANGLKEYTIGVEVFGRAVDYDTKSDPVVRLEMRRLRLKLSEFYRKLPTDCQICIEIPKGAYRPSFSPAGGTRSRVPTSAGPSPLRRLAGPFRYFATVSALFLTLSLSPTSRSGSNPTRPAIAVLPLEDLSPSSGYDWMATALAETLTSHLALSGALRPIPQDEVARLGQDLGLARGPLTALQLEQSARNLGCQLLITGTYSVSGDKLNLDLRVFQGQSESLKSTLHFVAKPDRILQLASEANQGIHALLGLGPQSQRKAFSPAFPAAPAMALYARALAHTRRMEVPAAKDLLEQGATIDPANPLILAALATAWNALGHELRAQETANQALALAASLSPSERQEIQAKCYTVLHRWDEAVAIYSAIFRLYPDDVETGLMLATVQLRAGNAEAAAQTIVSLRKQTLGDPRIDLLEARIYGQKSDFPRTAALAQRAAESAERNGARFLAARARLLEAGARQTLGEPQSAALLLQARRLCEELNDRSCQATALRIAGNFQVTNNQLAQGRASFTQALELARAAGNAGEIIQILNGIIYSALEQGDWRQAESSASQALSLAKEIQSQSAIATLLAQQANIAIETGRLPEAARWNKQALAVFESLGNLEGIAGAKATAATLARKQGHPSTALALYAAAETLLRQTSSPSAIANLLADRADLYIDLGNLAAASKDLDELQVLAQPTAATNPTQISLPLARLALAQGKPALADSLAQQAESVSRREQRYPAQARALLIRASALLNSSRPREAAQLASQAHTLASQILSPALVAESARLQSKTSAALNP